MQYGNDNTRSVCSCIRLYSSDICISRMTEQYSGKPISLFVEALLEYLDQAYPGNGLAVETVAEWAHMLSQDYYFTEVYPYLSMD